MIRHAFFARSVYGCPTLDSPHRSETHRTRTRNKIIVRPVSEGVYALVSTTTVRRQVAALLDDPRTREDGLRLLEGSSIRNAASIAAKYIHDSDEFVRNTALECLRVRGDRRYAERVADCLSDKAEIVVVTAIECLVAWGARSLCARLVPLLDARSALVRAYSAWALGMFYTHEAETTLTRRLEVERDPIARAGILESLVRLTRNRTYLERLLRLLSHKNHAVRAFAANSLTGVATARTAHLIRAALRDALDREDTLAGREALEKNLALLAVA